MHGQRLVLPVVLERAVQAPPALVTERHLLLVRELLVQATQQSLVIHAHGL